MNLESIDRTKLSGFKKYFRERRNHFEEIFKVPYSEAAASTACHEANDLRTSLKNREKWLDDLPKD